MATGGVVYARLLLLTLVLRWEPLRAIFTTLSVLVTEAVKLENLVDVDGTVVSLDLDDLGVPQQVHEYNEQVMQRLLDAEKYVREHVWNVAAVNDRLGALCRNQHESCAYWAALGECENNAVYMKLQCAPVCFSCNDQLHAETRCAIDPSVPDALHPGDLNKLFLRLTSDPISHELNVTVHSRPFYIPGDTIESVTYKIGPWIITMDNAIQIEQADRLVELGNIVGGYERSVDVGEELPDGTYASSISSARTSSNTCKVFATVPSFSIAASHLL
jgi:prolyl 4-hydroxylase